MHLFFRLKGRHPLPLYQWHWEWRSLFFCTLSLIIRIFTIIYNVRQHCYDNRGSPESWSSLLTSPLAEKGGDVNLAVSLVMSSHVTSLKHKAKHWYITKSISFSCFTKQTNSRSRVIYLRFSSCFSVGTLEDTAKHLASFTSFKTSVYCIFWGIDAPPLFSAVGDVSSELQLSGPPRLS